MEGSIRIVLHISTIVTVQSWTVYVLDK
jgi:hypothetical protein